jgi:hypothetical protein
MIEEGAFFYLPYVCFNIVAHNRLRGRIVKRLACENI